MLESYTNVEILRYLKVTSYPCVLFSVDLMHIHCMAVSARMVSVIFFYLASIDPDLALLSLSENLCFPSYPERAQSKLIMMSRLHLQMP